MNRVKRCCWALARFCKELVVVLCRFLFLMTVILWRGVLDFLSTLWRMVLRPAFKIAIFHCCILYCLYQNDLVPDAAYRGWLDDFVVITLGLRFITPAPRRKKKTRPAPTVPAFLARRANLPASANGVPALVVQGSDGRIPWEGAD